ncbi:PDZ and LIM domain protein 1 [Branchiostoma belcheri]|nr:PDZ and LIM domain protein 1 [Branchiostoma belcheri]
MSMCIHHPAGNAVPDKPKRIAGGIIFAAARRSSLKAQQQILTVPPSFEPTARTDTRAKVSGDSGEMDVVPSVIRVTLMGSPPWGFELEGGAEVGTDLTVAEVDMGSKAHMANILPGDVLLQIGLEKTQQMGKSEALRKLCINGGSLSLVLGRAQPKVWRPKYTPSYTRSEDTPYLQPTVKVSLKADKDEFEPVGSNFNTAPKGWGGNPEGEPAPYAPTTPAQRQQPLGQAIAELEQTEDVPRGFRSVRPPIPRANPKKEAPQTLPQCDACLGMIKGVFVKVNGKPRHPECFTCSACHCNLKQKGYYTVRGRLFCEMCTRARINHQPEFMELAM